MQSANLKIVKSTRFDDVDDDLGYEYCGCYYDIHHGGDVFLIRIYDTDLGLATVVRPTTMAKNSSLRALVEFLQSELGVLRVSLYKGDLGSYAEIDLNTLSFCSA